MFVDTAKITIASGKGGNGAVTFRREPFVPNGGPDGGNGGKGGDVIFRADKNLHTLMDFKYNRKYKAEAGQDGSKRNRYGKKGQNLTIKVPIGTVISDAKTGDVLYDLTFDGAIYIAAIGGKGGLGNSHFKSSVRQAPNFAEAGAEGMTRDIVLELKLIADVGLIGFPNVGKSTLLSVCSAARPKIANYHFTTLVPNLGVVEVDDTTFVMADIPGLIEGAAQGAGLGHDFLRHIERTRLLVHVLDVSGFEGRDAIDDFKKINAELHDYSPKLSTKPQIVALNKTDLVQDEAAIAEIKDYLDEHGFEHYSISAATGNGVKSLINHIAATLPNTIDDIADEMVVGQDATKTLRPEDEPHYRDVNISKDGNVFVLSGKQLKKIFDSTNFNDYGSIRYLYNYLVKKRVIDRMKADGLKEGDTVRMFDYEFEYTDE